MRASLVIPTLNESGSIGEVVRTFRAAADAANRTEFAGDPLEWEVLVVDGASTDGTAEAATREGARVLVERRRGYGRAYKTGFAAATGDIIATADGDGTYPVEEIPRFVRQLMDEHLDFLTGNRMAFLDRRAMTTEHQIGNRLLNNFLRLAYHHYLHDMPSRTILDSQSGFWVFRRSVLDRVALTQDGMAFSEELKIEAVLRGLRVRRGADPLRRALGLAETVELAGRAQQPALPVLQAARGRPGAEGRGADPLRAGRGDARTARVEVADYAVLPGPLARLHAEPVVAAPPALDRLRRVPGRAVHANLLVEQSLDRFGERHGTAVTLPRL